MVKDCGKKPKDKKATSSPPSKQKQLKSIPNECVECSTYKPLDLWYDAERISFQEKPSGEINPPKDTFTDPVRDRNASTNDTSCLQQQDRSCENLKINTDPLHLPSCSWFEFCKQKTSEHLPGLLNFCIVLPSITGDRGRMACQQYASRWRRHTTRILTSCGCRC